MSKKKMPAVGTRERPAELSDLPSDDCERLAFLTSKLMAPEIWYISAESMKDYGVLRKKFQLPIVIDAYGLSRTVEATDKNGMPCEIPIAVGPRVEVSTAHIRFEQLDSPRECPRACPALPPGTSRALDRRCRELEMLTGERKALYVGRQATPESLCGFPECDCFAVTAPAKQQPTKPTLVALDVATRSIVIGKCEAAEVPEDAFHFIRLLYEAYPNGVSWKDMQKSHVFNDTNQERVKMKVPPSLVGFIKCGKGILPRLVLPRRM